MKFVSVFGKRMKKSFSPALVITVTFALLIVIGALILCLPFCSKDGQSCGFHVSLFTSCSAVCVTGLSLVDTYTQWSGFGQAVILLMIQIGGLGFMTVFSMFMLILNEKIGIKKRMLLMQTFNLNDVHGIVDLLRRVLFLTGLIEGTGTVILTACFSFRFPFLKSLWMGIFHSVSSFCNAGFDIMGFIAPGSSLSAFSDDPVVCITVMFLIVSGGLGFFVWNDILNHGFKFGKFTVYTRLNLIITGILLFGGAFLFGVIEWNNPLTFGTMDTGNKILNAFFQSVTTRTAGFAAVSQQGLTDGAKALSCIWMLIGGSSGSTAGGIKTVTVGIALLSSLSVLRGGTHLTVMRRSVNDSQVSLAFSIVIMIVCLTFTGALIFTLADGVDFLSAFYESASALGTVGLTADVTPGLSTFSHCILIMFMFFGRVGITTISTGFLFNDYTEENIRYAETKLLIG